jgi:hypothetical protein
MRSFAEGRRDVFQFVESSVHNLTCIFSIIFSTGGKRAMAIEKPKYEVLRRNEVLIPVRKDSN